MTSNDANILARLEQEVTESIEEQEREELKADFELLDAEYLSVEHAFTPVGDDAPDSPLVFKKVTQRIVFVFLGSVVASVAYVAISSTLTTIQGFFR